MEEVCGACTININGRPGLACGSVVEDRKPLTLAPLTKFPVIRDLVVDRTKIYGTYKRFKLYSAPDAPKTPPKHVWEQIYPMTRCMSCGACTEVCPNTGGKTAFTGAAGIAVLRTLTALGIQGDLYGLTDNNGITSCGGHSLCADICPKNIDLPAAVSAVNRDINKRVLRRIFNKRGGK
jgi:succinate dehydrogenase / fumarate reductase iron-sulfur subunit